MARKKSPRHRTKKTLVRRRKALPPANFKRELAAGIKVEMEHTKHIRSKKKARQIATRIAKDHLRETPQYYRRLKKCFPEEHHNPGKKWKAPSGKVKLERFFWGHEKGAKGRISGGKLHLRGSSPAQLYERDEGSLYVRRNPAPGMSHMTAQFRMPGRNPKTMKNYIVKELMPNWKQKIDPRSIRTKTIRTKSGGKRLLRFGCPKGKWRPKMPKKKRCKVGTKAISILTPKSEKILSLHGVEAARRAAGNPNKKFWRDSSVRVSDRLRWCLAQKFGADSKESLISGRIASNLKQLANSEEHLEKDPRFKHLLRAGHIFGNPPGKLTIAEAKRQMPSEFSVTRDQSGDYVVKRRGAPESEWYYTDDLRDAVGTAQDMARRGRSANPNEISPAYRTFGYGKPGRIHAGMIVKVAGTNKRGRVVMPSSMPGYWVLNMGGPHGTPKVVHEDNIVTRGVGRNPGKVAIIPFSATSGCLSAKRFTGSCNECPRVESCKLEQSAGGRLRVSEDDVLRKQKDVDEAMKKLARAKEERDRRAKAARKSS